MITSLLKFGVPAVTLLAVGVGWMALDTGAIDDRQPDAEPLPVTAVRLERSDHYTVARSYAGQVVARRSVDLGFQRAGQVTAVEVDQGNRVAEGLVMARLDTRHLDAMKAKRTAERAQAEAVLRELEAGPRSETIAASAAEVQSLQAQAELERLTAQRQTELRRQNATSQQQLDQAVYSAQAAEARLDVARKKLEEYVAGTRGEQIDAQRAVVASIDAALADLAHDLEDSTLSAPFTGTIVDRYVDEGVVVSPAEPILRLVEDQQLEAWIGVPGSTAAGLEPGQEHSLLVEGRTYGGIVTAVLPELDPVTRTRRVVLSFGGADGGHVVPGQVVRLEVTEDVAEPGYWLPTEALIRGGRGLWACFAVVPADRSNGLTVEKRDVEILHTDGQRVFVRGTLQPEDRIVAGGTHRVVAGQMVRWTAPLDGFSVGRTSAFPG